MGKKWQLRINDRDYQKCLDVVVRRTVKMNTSCHLPFSIVSKSILVYNAKSLGIKSSSSGDRTKRNWNFEGLSFSRPPMYW